MAEEKKNNIWWWVIAGLGAVVLVLVLIFLLQGKENYIAGGEQMTRVGSLNCSISHSEEAFFQSETVQRYTHEVRAIYRGDKLEDISYTYNGTYASPEAVEDASAILHAKYNKYMGENGVNPESLTPQFSNLKSKLKVSLYGDKSKIDKVTAPLFFLTEEEVAEVGKYNLSKLEKLYKGKGFSCVKQD
ncbi:hypothetical protein IKF03_03700 [Candidatus Saccharibacteria bacterium]|nr:hypothetical protein [Candidatus Saccharibacteria bacterium]